MLITPYATEQDPMIKVRTMNPESRPSGEYFVGIDNSPEATIVSSAYPMAIIPNATTDQENTFVFIAYT